MYTYIVKKKKIMSHTPHSSDSRSLVQTEQYSVFRFRGSNNRQQAPCPRGGGGGDGGGGARVGGGGAHVGGGGARGDGRG